MSRKNKSLKILWPSVFAVVLIAIVIVSLKIQNPTHNNSGLKNKALPLTVEVLLNKEIQKLTSDIDFQSIDEDQSLMEKLSKTEPLILFISDLHCSSCVNQQLKFLADRPEIHNVIILGQYDENRVLKVLLKSNNVPLPAFNLPKKSNDGFSKILSPVYFRIHSNLSLSDVFSPNLDQPNQTLSYLSDLL